MQNANSDRTVHASRERDLHLMYSLIGDRRTLTREAKNAFDYEDQEHATTTLRGLRVLRGAIVFKHIELRSHPFSVPFLGKARPGR